MKEFLSGNFEMKDLRESDVILNIKLLRGEGNGGLTLVHSHYVKKALNHIGYSDCTFGISPQDSNVLLKTIK